MTASNSLVGFFNFLTFLASVPVLGAGIWLSSRANTADCLKFLEWPFIAIGVSIMVVSLAGFAGACYRNTYLLRFYLVAMFFIIVALIGFVIFAYGVTSRGSGRLVLGRVYRDYYLTDYSGWLEERVADEKYWADISSCVRESRVCARIRRELGGVPEPAELFYIRPLTPVESGCCKPPTECNFIYVNETMWNPGVVPPGGSTDCARWSNDQAALCYACDSCKAGVLGSLKDTWRKAALINIIAIIVLVILYGLSYAAYRNSRKNDTNEAYGAARMTKSHPAVIRI
ncbi:hypothetical protein Sjap_013952 [Stephania japonica]|uniref:Tetraspanin-3 n=1 Tax=Stephania japonica TaxID=461633 RepID=A0AAP0J041_9MAGN